MLMFEEILKWTKSKDFLFLSCEWELSAFLSITGSWERAFIISSSESCDFASSSIFISLSSDLELNLNGESSEVGLIELPLIISDSSSLLFFGSSSLQRTWQSILAEFWYYLFSWLLWHKFVLRLSTVFCTGVLIWIWISNSLYCNNVTG